MEREMIYELIERLNDDDIILVYSILLQLVSDE